MNMIQFLSNIPGKFLIASPDWKDPLQVLFKKEDESPFEGIINFANMAFLKPTFHTFEKNLAVYSFRKKKTKIWRFWEGINPSGIYGDRSLWKEVLDLYPLWKNENLSFYPVSVDDLEGSELSETKNETS
jgi:hypothetical protein